MVQSLKLGGSANSLATSGIKRVNRVPVIVVIVLLVAFLGIIFYGLASRGLYFGKDSGPEASSGNPASTYADQIKRGVTDGIIGEPQPQTMFQPTPVETKQAEEKAANPFTQPEQRPEQRGSELEPEEVWRARLAREQQEQGLREQQRQRMARMQARDSAYDAPLAIDRGKLEVRPEKDESAMARRTTTAATNGSASDLYAAALRAGLGGQNVDPNGQSLQGRLLQCRPQGPRLSAKPRRATAVPIRAKTRIGHSRDIDHRDQFRLAGSHHSPSQSECL